MMKLFGCRGRNALYALVGAAVGGGFLLYGLLGIATARLHPELGGPGPAAWAALSLLMLLALALFVHNLRTLWFRSRRMRLSGSPAWIADYPWNPRGTSHSPLGDAIENLVYALLVSALMGAILYGAASRPGGLASLREAEGWEWGLLAGGFLLALTWGHAAQYLLRAYRFGAQRLEFAPCPYRLGEPLRATIVTSGPVPDVDRLIVRLVHVEERVRWRRGRASLRTHDHVCAEMELPPTEALRTRVPVELDTAAHRGPTSLCQAEPRYYERRLHMQRAGLDLEASFLVPLY